MTNDQAPGRPGSATRYRLGALGLVLHALVLFDTRYVDAAVARLRTDGFDVRERDATPLPFRRHHLNTLGRYSFQPPEPPGGPRPLSDPSAVDER